MRKFNLCRITEKYGLELLVHFIYITIMHLCYPDFFVIGAGSCTI